MKFTVNVDTIKEALQSVVGATEKRTTIPILGGVLIKSVGDKLFLSATDLELAISTELEASVKEDGSVVIPAKKMLDYVKLLDSDTVSVSVSKEFWCSFTAGKSRTRIAGMDPSAFPELPEFDMSKSDNRLDPVVFKRVIERGTMATSQKEGRFAFHGVLFSASNGKGMVASTDSARISIQKFPLDGEFRFVAPKRIFAEVYRYLGSDSDVRFYIENNRLFFAVNGVTLSVPKIESTYPDIERAIPKDLGGSITIKKNVLYRALERASKFADELSHSVKLTFSPSGSSVTAESKSGSDCEEDLDFVFEKEHTCLMNSYYIMEYIKACGGEDVTISFKDKDTAHLISDGVEDSTYILAPMRF